MNKKFLHTICLVMALSLLIGAFPVAQAVEARASDYFWYTDVRATPQGGGKLIVEFDVGSTEIMTELGASKIVIYEQQSNGTYAAVKTFTRYNTSGMIVKDDSCVYNKVSYSGTSGTKYYAVITFYAKNAKGSETKQRTTNTITA